MLKTFILKIKSDISLGKIYLLKVKYFDLKKNMLY